ncbi:MAG: leucine-rich repeat domain-containing protein, partial [Oscillibacter sp.]|nr:leucine-rich repeat domain-containing protein [Oscillibacter sp.]
MRIRKRIGAWALVLCLLLGMIPTYAGAAETPDPADTSALLSEVDIIPGQTISQSTTSGGTNTVTVESRTGDSQDAANTQDADGTDGDTLSGTCGDNLTWTLSNGTLTVSGTGAMTDYPTRTDVPWYDNRASIENVVIERGVTSIGGYAFSDCTSLTSVTIPEGVTWIDYGAFYSCSGLTSVTIPTSVTSIGASTFYNCSALTDVYYGGTEAQWATLQRSIGSSNDPLLNATIHYNSSGETSADGDTLSGTCGDNLTWTLANGTLTVSGTGAMTNYDTASAAPWNDYRASITSATFESGVTSVGSHALNACANLRAVSLPNGLTTVGYSAFRDCTSLTGVALPDTVTTIGGDAFRGCSA